jgi:hypothetical protein
MLNRENSSLSCQAALNAEYFVHSGVFGGYFYRGIKNPGGAGVNPVNAAKHAEVTADAPETVTIVRSPALWLAKRIRPDHIESYSRVRHLNVSPAIVAGLVRRRSGEFRGARR